MAVFMGIPGSRPASPGEIPSGVGAQFGYACAPTLLGPWVKSTTNPVPYPNTYTGIKPWQNTNMGPGSLTWDSVNNCWLQWYASGDSDGATPTYAVIGVGDYNWTLITDDDFHRANSGTVGNGWTDNAGGKYSISSNTLHADSSSGGTSFLTRPSSENHLEQMVVIRFQTQGTNNDAFECILRGQSVGTSGYTTYQCYAYQGGLNIVSEVSGSENSLHNFGTQITASGHVARIEFACRQTPDVTPGTSTNLWVSLYDETAASNPIFNNAGNVVTDTTGSGLQSAGLSGINYYGGGGDTGVYVEFLNYQLTQTDGITINFPSSAVPSGGFFAVL